MFSNILDRKLYIEYGPTNLEIEVTNDNHIEIYQFILSIFKLDSLMYGMTSTFMIEKYKNSIRHKNRLH